MDHAKAMSGAVPIVVIVDAATGWDRVIGGIV